ncbi:hypothetical protein BD779DRAFT_1548363 [Infundibulicybe gibba]|nr:hypothetical protein BD779DRAFT_1548363 [Infundibulicybe gibba]
MRAFGLGDLVVIRIPVPLTWAGAAQTTQSQLSVSPRNQPTRNKVGPVLKTALKQGSPTSRNRPYQSRGFHQRENCRACVHQAAGPEQVASIEFFPHRWFYRGQ